MAQHYYSFSIDTEVKQQIYAMNCQLCGKGSATSSYATTDSPAQPASSDVSASSAESVSMSLSSTLDNFSIKISQASSSLASSSSSSSASAFDDEDDDAAVQAVQNDQVAVVHNISLSSTLDSLLGKFAQDPKYLALQQEFESQNPPDEEK